MCTDLTSRRSSAQDHLFAGARLLGIWQAHHPERDEQSGQARDGNEQWHLNGEVPGLGVDPDDLVLCLLRLAGELLLSWVLLTTWASCSKTLTTCCCSAPDSTVLDWAMLVKPTDSAASKMAPACQRQRRTPA